jgi:DNA-binding NarL/FixJ family response regulator
MPGVPGLEALKALATPGCAVRTIVLTAGLDKDGLISALQHGARGIVLKESATKLLFQSIRCVMADQYWLGRENIEDVVDALKRLTSQMEDQTKRRRFGLTARELQVVAAAAAGESNKEISARLRVSEETIKHHLSNIFDKLGVFSRVELAVFAVNHGLMTDSAPAS